MKSWDLRVPIKLTSKQNAQACPAHENTCHQKYTKTISSLSSTEKKEHGAIIASGDRMRSTKLKLFQGKAWTRRAASNLTHRHSDHVGHGQVHASHDVKEAGSRPEALRSPSSLLRFLLRRAGS